MAHLFKNCSAEGHQWMEAGRKHTGRFHIMSDVWVEIQVFISMLHTQTHGYTYSFRGVNYYIIKI